MRGCFGCGANRRKSYHVLGVSLVEKYADRKWLGTRACGILMLYDRMKWIFPVEARRLFSLDEMMFGFGFENTHRLFRNLLWGNSSVGAFEA